MANQRPERGRLVANHDAAELIENILEGPTELVHYGRKGMRWGIRRSREQLARGKSSTPEPVKVDVTPGKRVKARGGTGQHPSQDAIRVAKNLQKAKASTTDSLSTAQLKEVVSRMQLEKQFRDLNPPKVSLGQKVVEYMIKEEGGRLLKSGDVKATTTYKLGTQFMSVAAPVALAKISDKVVARQNKGK